MQQEDLAAKIDEVQQEIEGLVESFEQFQTLSQAAKQDKKIMAQLDSQFVTAVVVHQPSDNVAVSSNTVKIKSGSDAEPKQFAFDVVTTDTAQLSDTLTAAVRKGFRAGRTGTYFTYGTSQVRNTTKPGSEIADHLQRVAVTLIEEANKAPEPIEVSITAVIIKREHVFDLCQEDADKLDTTSATAAGLELKLNREKQEYELLGQKSRSLSAGGGSADSAKQTVKQLAELADKHATLNDSTTIFTLHVVNRQHQTEQLFRFMQLPGSERRAASGDETEQRAANAVNLTLSAVGNVLGALAKCAPHVAFRDCKTTLFGKQSMWKGRGNKW